MFTYRFCPISDLSRTEQNGYPAFVCRLKSPTINDMAISVLAASFTLLAAEMRVN